ncbi:hypothetical protein GCM10010156_08800 [Planobispora rosea]|uniref:Uncharacterized protein n=1 Tax=Planobispora rosea TaxID=35762 RepID=A0A8J3WBD9_PLARO|nr:hypothetical protein [Planobispora rosea]GGS52372.1 hypothetical protein GCM10010156_08800 [Planobispora rosea]GIH83045.1 hypothetical protein Pro02_14530 [Planobispora rosea]
MTITESDLRELFEHDSETGPGRAVTLAGVDRRIRRTRRRRAGLAAGVAAAGLAAGVFVLPSGGASVTPEEVWTGVMAQPEKRYGARQVFETPLDESFSAMGERVAFDVPRLPPGNAWVEVSCPRGARVLVWENGKYLHDRWCEEARLTPEGPAPEELSGSSAFFGLGQPGTGRLEVAVVPAEAVERLGRPLTGERDAQKVVEAAEDGRADLRIRIITMRVEPCDSEPDCQFADEPAPTVPPRLPMPED